MTRGSRDGRVGSRLQRLRVDSGYSVRAAARWAGVSRRRLRSYEAGRRPAPTEVRRVLTDLYEVPLGALLPKRNLSKVVVEPGAVRIGRSVQRTGSVHAHRDDVLNSYLSLVNRLRGLDPGESFDLRADDLEHLAATFRSHPDDIEERLVDLLHCSRAEAERIKHLLLKRRMLVPAAGMAMGVAALGMPNLQGLQRSTIDAGPGAAELAVRTEGLEIAMGHDAEGNPFGYPLTGEGLAGRPPVPTTVPEPSSPTPDELAALAAAQAEAAADEAPEAAPADDVTGPAATPPPAPAPQPAPPPQQQAPPTTEAPPPEEPAQQDPPPEEPTGSDPSSGDTGEQGSTDPDGSGNGTGDPDEGDGSGNSGGMFRIFG